MVVFTGAALCLGARKMLPELRSLSAALTMGSTTLKSDLHSVVSWLHLSTKLRIRFSFVNEPALILGFALSWPIICSIVSLLSWSGQASCACSVQYGMVYEACAVCYVKSTSSNVAKPSVIAIAVRIDPTFFTSSALYLISA